MTLRVLSSLKGRWITSLIRPVIIRDVAKYVKLRNVTLLCGELARR